MKDHGDGRGHRLLQGGLHEGKFIVWGDLGDGRGHCLLQGGLHDGKLFSRENDHTPNLTTLTTLGGIMEMVVDTACFKAVFIMKAGVDWGGDLYDQCLGSASF